jgi:hypothetical protein
MFCFVSGLDQEGIHRISGRQSAVGAVSKIDAPIDAEF